MLLTGYQHPKTAHINHNKVYKLISFMAMMEKIKFEVEGYECKRCKHQWVPKRKDPPKVCPFCCSRYWQTEVRFPTISKAQKKRKRKK